MAVAAKAISGHVVALVIALVVASCGGNSGAQNGSPGSGASPQPTATSNEATTRWVDLMASTYYEPRSTGDVRLARFGNSEAMVPLLNGLRSALNEAQNNDAGMADRIAVLTGYRSIWKNDAVLKSDWDVRVERLKQLPDAEIVEWQKALSKANDSAVSGLWTRAFVSDIPDLFPQEKFDIAKSTNFRARLESVPGEAVHALADALKMGRAYAAILIVQNPDFFVPASFARAIFDGAVEGIRKKVAPAK